ncbi:hypothetical protein WA026_006372 [Henosepilachna vigintioctopunctata]|uniref:Uncharacterized protein n=1 Tax=Henosepilachna vigintioctopunctata TaxID=420089 RepID=A0AAW1TNN9_9CUCU
MDESDNEDNFNPHALEEFLNAYSEKLRKKHHNTDHNEYEESEKVNDETHETTLKSPYDNKDEKSKYWNVMHVKNHNHPFDDKNGWVSLDPVPWSLSKISKWHNEKKTTKRPQVAHDSMETSENSWEADLETSEYSDIPHKPFWNTKPRPYQLKPVNHDRPLSTHTYLNEEDEDFDNYHHLKPTIVIHSPDLTKLESMYGHKIQLQYDLGESNYNILKDKDYLKRPYQNTHRYDSYDYNNCDHSSENIVTDNRPSNFPNTQHIRKKSSGLHGTHSFEGNGEWVLLSTTKGFKRPQNRRRSLQLPPSPTNNIVESVGLRKGVHLTVLPPLKNSKVNMTTSHGGLLQVESTFETVDQAQERAAKKLKLKDNTRKKPTKVRIVKNNKFVNNPVVHKMNLALPIATINKRISKPDISTVLAAAGAGMIPATMAMLVPMALGAGKKRRKRSVHHLKFLGLGKK